MRRVGTAPRTVRGRIGGYHPGLRGISRSYLEASRRSRAGASFRPDPCAPGTTSSFRSGHGPRTRALPNALSFTALAA